MLGLAMAAVQAAHAADPLSSQLDLSSCASIEAPSQRLACYDTLAGRGVLRAPAAGSPSAAPVPDAPREPAAAAPVAGAGLAAPVQEQEQDYEDDSVMSAFWELDEKDKRGVFRFLSYRPNYVLPLHYTTAINQSPDSPTPNRNGTLPSYRNIELKLQLSLRTKIAQGLFVPNGDLWFAYTQQSLWQIWNKQESSPFRSTDYEPEAIYVLSVPRAMRKLPLGWQFRMVQLGIAHQSNGQTIPLSRSWNRVYAGAGFERGDVSLTTHVWKRLREDADNDDNPDLVAYRGHGDVSLTWTPGRAIASLTWRTNFRDMSRGSWQLDWTYPVDSSRPKGLRWYAQIFTGYGETLLDYNFRQTSVGFGLSLFEF